MGNGMTEEEYNQWCYEHLSENLAEMIRLCGEWREELRAKIEKDDFGPEPWDFDDPQDVEDYEWGCEILRNLKPENLRVIRLR